MYNTTSRPIGFAENAKIMRSPESVDRPVARYRANDCGPLKDAKSAWRSIKLNIILYYSILYYIILYCSILYHRKYACILHGR